jgi:hypothetical protein
MPGFNGGSNLLVISIWFILIIILLRMIRYHSVGGKPVTAFMPKNRAIVAKFTYWFNL